MQHAGDAQNGRRKASPSTATHKTAWKHRRNTRKFEASQLCRPGCCQAHACNPGRIPTPLAVPQGPGSLVRPPLRRLLPAKGTAPPQSVLHDWHCILPACCDLGCCTQRHTQKTSMPNIGMDLSGRTLICLSSPSCQKPSSSPRRERARQRSHRSFASRRPASS